MHMKGWAHQGPVLFLLFLFTNFSARFGIGAANSPSLLTDGSRSVKIYVYNVSERFRTSAEAWVWQHQSLYGLEMTFPVQLLASPYVTNDPKEADYFFVHAWLYHSQVRNIDQLVQELKRLGPWWDMKGGRDHIFLLTHDHGLCEGEFRTYIRHSIIMQHWGKVTGVQVDNPCWVVTNWGDRCDQLFRMTEFWEAGKPLPWPCYVRGKDLVVPTMSSEKESTSKYLNPELDKVPTTKLVMFGGGVNQTHMTHPDHPEADAGYSFGIRQTFARLYDQHPEVTVMYKMVPEYWSVMAGTTFCLSPPGWGWGARVKTAITRGCIPLIMSDGIKVDWEDQLPLKDFAVRLPMMHIHRIPEILHKFVRTGRVKFMQKNLRCIWRLFWWSRPHGRAFEMTMCALKARLFNKTINVNWDLCAMQCGDSKWIKWNPPADMSANLTGIHSV